MTPATLPEDGTVAVHLQAFARESLELARYERFLAPDELQRAGRLIDPQARSRFIAGRGFLRETLAGCLGEEPARLRLAAGEFGKPCLAEAEKSPGICFNLSHAGDYCLLAVAVNRSVGIDLELVRDGLPFREMARRYFSERERAELFSLPEDYQLAAFYRCWTRKEAYLKGCGTGFSQPCDSFDVSLLPGAPPALLRHRTAPSEPARWRIVDIPVPAGYSAALATEGEAPVIYCFPEGVRP